MKDLTTEQKLEAATLLLIECRHYIETVPSRIFMWFCTGLFVGFLIGRFV